MKKIYLNLKSAFAAKYTKNKTSHQMQYFQSMENIMSNIIGEKEYLKNAIVYKCVKLISESASHVPLVTLTHNTGNGQLIKNKQHYCNKLLRRPNPLQGGAEFFTRVVTNKLLYGESYILMIQNPISQKQIELKLLNNENVEVCIENNRIVKYLVKNSTKKNVKDEYKVDHISQQSKILHLTNYNPLNPLRGLSFLAPAAKAINLHNKAMEWNNTLLHNGARPSGALVVKDSNRYLNQEEFDRLKNQITEKYSGHNNIGKPLVLEGGLDWKEMSMSPKDMDFAESKDSAAREIALACGIPPQLLGIKGDNTYSNMQEARIALWEETVIPLLDNLTDALSNWFSYWMDEDITIDFDRDSISAITSKRDNLWAKISSVDFITQNEKRELLGFPPLEN